MRMSRWTRRAVDRAGRRAGVVKVAVAVPKRRAGMGVLIFVRWVPDWIHQFAWNGTAAAGGSTMGAVTRNGGCPAGEVDAQRAGRRRVRQHVIAQPRRPLRGHTSALQLEGESLAGGVVPGGVVVDIAGAVRRDDRHAQLRDGRDLGSRPRPRRTARQFATRTTNGTPPASPARVNDAGTTVRAFAVGDGGDARQFGAVGELHAERRTRWLRRGGCRSGVGDPRRVR